MLKKYLFESFNSWNVGLKNRLLQSSFKCGPEANLQWLSMMITVLFHWVPLWDSIFCLCSESMLIMLDCGRGVLSRCPCSTKLKSYVGNNYWGNFSEAICQSHCVSAMSRSAHQELSGRVTTCSNLLFYNAGARTQTFRTLGVRTPPWLAGSPLHPL